MIENSFGKYNIVIHRRISKLCMKEKMKEGDKEKKKGKEINKIKILRFDSFDFEKHYQKYGSTFDN